MGTLNLCQKMRNNMQRVSGSDSHQVWRKCPKCGENWPFWAILDVFSGCNDQIELNPFESGQASSGTSLEYPHGVF